MLVICGVIVLIKELIPQNSTATRRMPARKRAQPLNNLIRRVAEFFEGRDIGYLLGGVWVTPEMIGLILVDDR
jgi:hypothetical protein